ncbi:hypothetical protein HHL19_32345 [Streptomyces sp. R302]|uniref:hypothetical protein n=1 Tax=unclassified Streptomyces TaxID=2593676 RepID=UPI00145CD375|nr:MULTISPECIES: hypothetical protein [unclassified Streptomyces]NML53950.1 hypothetical protein [Streptomyces sp. R301]NML83210.1 hypothetical protein [Streptomyces sp. R302]
MRKIRVAIATAAVAVTLGAVAPAAQADESQLDGLKIAQRVFDSGNPEQAYAGLSGAEKEAMEHSTKPVKTVLLKTEIQAVPGAKSEAGALGCWNTWQRWGKKAAAGNTVYTWWQGLEWCGSGGKITSYKVYDRGGETATPGWSYSGNDGAGSRNVGWEVRQYTKQKFTFGIGQYGYSTSECGQIRGGATGLYSQRASCTLS